MKSQLFVQALTDIQLGEGLQFIPEGTLLPVVGYTTETLGVAWCGDSVSVERRMVKAVPQGTEARVCADIAQRQQHGVLKYGQTVERNPLSHRQWLQHAYEEALDFAIYLKRTIEELDKSPVPVEEDDSQRRPIIDNSH